MENDFKKMSMFLIQHGLIIRWSHTNNHWYTLEVANKNGTNLEHTDLESLMREMVKAFNERRLERLEAEKKELQEQMEEINTRINSILTGDVPFTIPEPGGPEVAKEKEPDDYHHYSESPITIHVSFDEDRDLFEIMQVVNGCSEWAEGATKQDVKDIIAEFIEGHKDSGRAFSIEYTSRAKHFLKHR